VVFLNTMNNRWLEFFGYSSIYLLKNHDYPHTPCAIGAGGVLRIALTLFINQGQYESFVKIELEYCYLAQKNCFRIPHWNWMNFEYLPK
jgi:hypothetical protein